MNNKQLLKAMTTKNEPQASRRRLDRVVGFLCEVVAWTLYGLSKVHLARKPWYTSCIAEFSTCGYCMDHNGFPRFPLWSLARKFDEEWEARKANPTGQRAGHLVDGTLTPLVGRCKVCDGKKWVKYDSNHARPCTACCDHGADGWWELSKYHAGFVDGGDNRCCRGCGELWRDLYPTNPKIDGRGTL